MLKLTDVKRTSLAYLVLLSLCLAYVGWWHHADNRPLTWDPTVHLGLAIDYRDWLFHQTPLTNSRTSMYPPLYHVSLLPSLMIGIPSEAKAVTTHLLYAAILLMAFIGLAKRMGRPVEDAFLAAVLTLSYPIVHYIFCFALTDFPLLAFVALGMWFLYNTDDFTDRRSSLAFGAVSGLGLLIKQPFPFYFILPCLWSLVSSRPESRRVRFVNFALACGLTILVAGPWYWWESIFGLQNGLGQAFERGTAQHLPDFRTVEGWLWYIRLLPDQMGVAGVVVTGVGLLLLPFSGLERRAVLFLSLWALSGYAGMSMIHNKDPRYDVAILPALAMLSALGWTGRSTSPLARRIFVILGALGLLVWAAGHSNPPLKEDWKHADIGLLLRTRHDPEQPFMIASVEANDPHFFGRTLRWSVRQQGAKLFNAAPGDPMADFTEFVIVKVGDKGPDGGPLAEEWRQLQESGRRFTVLFPLIGHFPLPDGSQADIYQRQKDHVFQVGTVTKEVLQSRLRAALAELIEGPMTVDLEGSADLLQKGRVENAVISGGPWILRGIPIAKAELRIRKAWLNLYTLWDVKKPGLLAFEAIDPHIEIRAQDLQALLVKKVREINDPTVHFEKGLVRVEALWKNIRLKVSLKISVEENPPILVAAIHHIQIGWVPISPWLLGRAHQFEVPLYPTPPLPGRLQIHQVVADNDLLTIS